MRAEVLGRKHEGHLGIEKCNRRGKGALYWLGMNKAIKRKVKKCATFLTYQYQQRKETSMDTLDPHSIKAALENGFRGPVLNE